MFYEHDGIDQDGNGIMDQGTNGIDDDAYRTAWTTWVSGKRRPPTLFRCAASRFDCGSSTAIHAKSDR